MTVYQMYTRIRHFVRAKHWRGAAIHSPMMYAFVRKYALKNRGERLIEAIGGHVVDSVEELADVKGYDIVILREPFRDKSQKIFFDKWYAENHVVTAHFQGVMVIFFDKKLQKQQYMIRN